MKHQLTLASLVAAIALGHSGIARSEGITAHIAPFAATSSHADARTRAEVAGAYLREREVVAAMNGEDSGSLYLSSTQFRSERTRAEVTAEYTRTRDVVAAMNGEDGGSLSLSRTPFRSEATRAEVVADFIRDRETVAAMNGEDSGAQHLTRARRAGSVPVHLGARRMPGIQR